MLQFSDRPVSEEDPAGCSRDVIEKGAEMLGWELDELLEKTLQAMQACEDEIQAQEAL